MKKPPKTVNFLIIDENKLIIETFRGKATAMQMIRGLRKTHVGADLKIVSIEEYENLEKTLENPPKVKREVFYNQDETWIE